MMSGELGLGNLWLAAACASAYRRYQPELRLANEHRRKTFDSRRRRQVSRVLRQQRISWATRGPGRHRLDDRHRDLPYRVLWRLTAGEPHLLEVVTDPDVHALGAMERAVRRASHKMNAVRALRIPDPTRRIPAP
jgi:hypothetical protein